MSGAYDQDYEDDFQEDEDAKKEDEDDTSSDDDEDDDDSEDESEDDDDDDADDDDEDEDEDSDDEEELTNPWIVKVHLANVEGCRVLKLPNDIKRNQFLIEVTNATGVDRSTPYSVKYFHEPSNDMVLIDSRQALKIAQDSYWKGTMDTMKIVVEPLGAPAALDVSQLQQTQQQVQQQGPTFTESTNFASSANTCGGGPSSPRSDIVRELEEDKDLTWSEIRVLGHGSYGRVVEALTSTGKIMAVKRLIVAPEATPGCLYQAENAQEGDESGDAAREAAEMVEEIRLMKNLRHKHIVQYYGCQMTRREDGSRVIDIFLEPCHNGSLTSLRKKFDKQRGRLSVQLVRTYTKQVLEGLAYLHRKKVVHRDIKGDNVLIAAGGDAKLADFGCSKKVGTQRFSGETGSDGGFGSSSNAALGSSATAVAAAIGGGDGGGGGGGGLNGSDSGNNNNNQANCQTMVGTPQFMAPEVMQASTQGAYGSPADIWSVGCLVIELFGEKPWKVQGSNMFTIMFAVAKATGLPTGMPTTADPLMTDFLTQCFQRDPALRPTAAQLLQHEWFKCKKGDLTEPTWE